MADLESLRAQLTPVQCEILNAVWDFYRQRAEWISARVLHHRFGKEAVRSALQQLGGSIAYEAKDSGKERYGLTFLGVLLTDQEEEIEQLFAGYLSYLRDRFDADPGIELVKSQEVEAALHLSVDQSRFLSRLIRLGHFYGDGGSFGDQEWSVGLPYNVEDLLLVKDFRAFVRMSVVREFDPSVPVFDRERIQYLLARPQKNEPHDEFAFISEAGLREQLWEDWQEAQKVHAADARKSCVILCGGVLEGILLDALASDRTLARERYTRPRGRRPVDLHQWSLADLIDVAEEHGILRKATIHLSQALREYRNLIHPGRQMRAGMIMSKEEANIAINVVRICLRELATRRG
jgi:hypothetical protein